MNGTERGWGHWLWRPWRLTFHYAGRSPRREYWLFVAQCFANLIVMGIALAASSEKLPRKDGDPWGPLFTAGVIVTLLLVVPWLSVAVRRVHDHDKSGWMTLLVLVPGIGWIFHLILTCTPGSQGENHYGPDPRDPHLSDGAVTDIFS